MSLNPEQKEKWLEALRSGEYEQGKNQLKTKDGKYCCLGVFAACNNIEIDSNGKEMVVDGERVSYGPIVLQIGMKVNQLWSMNDFQDKSFLEIADYIEQNL